MLKAGQLSDGAEQLEDVMPHAVAQDLGKWGIRTTVDLVAAIEADVEAVAAALPGQHLAMLQKHLGRRSARMVADVSAQARVHPLGASPPPDAVVVASAEMTAPPSLAPAPPSLQAVPVGGDDAVALRSDLRQRFGPIRDQGQRGTCVGHACAALAGAVLRDDASLDLSPQFNYYHSKQLDRLPPADEGTWIAVALPTASSLGICREACWPYEPDVRPGDFTHGSPPPIATADAPNQRVAEVAELGARNAVAMSDALDRGSPVAFSIPVYESWVDNAAVNLDGVIPLPLPTSKLKGGHAMCAVGSGFDDDVPGGWFFVVRNSWGTDWATQSMLGPGYGALPFSYVEHYGWEAFTAEVAS